MHIWIAWSVQMFVDICTSKKYPSMQEDMLDRYAAPLWLMKQIKLLNFICLTQRDASHSLKPPYYRCPRVSTTVLPRQPLRLQRWTWLKGKCGVCISVVYVVYIYIWYMCCIVRSHARRSRVFFLHTIWTCSLSCDLSSLTLFASFVRMKSHVTERSLNLHTLMSKGSRVVKARMNGQMWFRTPATHI